MSPSPGSADSPSGARHWAALLLLWAAFGVSLFFNGLHIPLLSLSVVALALFAALALGPGIRAGWAVPRSAPAAWLVAFWTFLALSLAGSTVVFTSSLYYWWIGAMPLTFFGLLLARAPETWIRRALMGLGALVLVLAVWALVQFFGLPETYHYRAQHPLLNPNNLAGLFGLALPPALAAYFRSRERRRTGLLLAGVLLLVAGVVATQSRGAYVGLAAGLGVLLVGSRGLPGVNRRRVGAFAGAALAVFALMNAWSGGGVGQRLETLGAVGAQSSFQTRLVIWDATLEMVRERPWTGFGLGTFFLHYPRFRHPDDGSGGYYAHMDPLQYWAETGIGGPVLFYLFLIAVLWRTVRAVHSLPVASGERLAVLGPFAGLLAVAVHTHITFHLYILPILIGLGAVLAAWHLATERALARGRVTVSLPEGAHPRVWQGILGGLVLLVVIFMGAAGASDRFIQWGQDAVRRGEIARALDYFHYARALTPNSATPYALGAEIRQRALAGAASGLSAAERRALYREGHRFLDRAQARNPVRARLDHLRARLFLVAPDMTRELRFARAEGAWQRALGKDPRLLEARLGLAGLYHGQGQGKEARTLLEAGLKWPYPGPEPVPLYLRAAQQRSMHGDRSGAEELARKALARVPGDSGPARAIRERFGIRDGEGSGPHGAP